MEESDGRISLDDFTPTDIEAVLGWRYQGEYARYNLNAAHRTTLQDPANGFLAIRRDGELIGHVCTGSEARVVGMVEDPALIDVGVGMRPDLTGRGESSRVMSAVLKQLGDQRGGGVVFRAVVMRWNIRARRAAENAGFAFAGTHQNESGRWVVLSRAAQPDG